MSLEAILAAAESAIGVQYQWGGNSLAKGVDCSGLVQQAFMAGGYLLPRVSNSQANTGQRVASLAEAQPGDLLSWDNSSRNVGADHIAIYLGNGLMIEAPRRGVPVRVVKVNESGVRVNRIIGAMQPQSAPIPVTLGPNQDRTYTQAAVAGTAAPAVSAESVSVTGTAGGGLGDDLPPDASPQEVEAYLRRNYPDVAPFLQNEEIKNLVFSSVKDGSLENPNEFMHRFRQTDYYRTHSPQARRLDALLGTDRNAAIRAIEGAKEIVADAATRAGLTLNDQQLGEAAKNALKQGYVSFSEDGTVGVGSTDGLNEWVAGGLRFQRELGGDLQGGEIGMSVDAVLALAKKYLVPITQRQAEDMALRMMDGSESQDSVEQWLRGLAEDRFLGQDKVLASLAAGRTPEQHFSSHVATVANTLELAESEIDLTDPKWSWLIEVRDEKGNVRTPSLAEVGLAARARPEFAETRQYKSTDAEYGVGLSRFLGMVA